MLASVVAETHRAIDSVESSIPSRRGGTSLHHYCRAKKLGSELSFTLNPADLVPEVIESVSCVI